MSSTRVSSSGNYEEIKKHMNELRQKGLFAEAIDFYKKFLVNKSIVPHDNLLTICEQGRNYKELLKEYTAQPMPTDEKLKAERQLLIADMQKRIEVCKTKKIGTYIAVRLPKAAPSNSPPALPSRKPAKQP